MAIRRLKDDRLPSNGGRFNKRVGSVATVSTLPTVKAMVDCFDRYLNLTIADGHASNDTVKTYRSRVHQFLSWCKEGELYPALITTSNIIEYRKYLVDGSKTSPTIRLSLLAIKHFYTACSAEKEEIVQYRQVRKSTSEKLTSTSPLFISLSNRRYGQRLSRSGINHVVDGYLEKCGLKHSDLERNLSPHSLRHTAGTLSLQNGSSLREVQDFLGHSDPKTTAVYTHVLSSQENNPASKIEIDF